MMAFTDSRFERLIAQRGDKLRESWLLVLLGVLTICCESTERMGASHTVVWLAQVVQHLHLTGSIDSVSEANHYLRKTGHFLGYGTLGLCFSRGWLAVVVRLSRKTWSIARARAAGYGIAATAVVASLDELHQSFVPGRGSSGWDVLLDTSGAIMLVGAYFTFRWVRRRQTMDEIVAFRSLLQRGRQRRAYLNALRSCDLARQQMAL